MVSLKTKIIGEKIMILGCILLISVYISGVIVSVISLKLLFSDFWESTIITMLSIVILFFVVQNYNTDTKLLEKKEPEEE